MRALWIFGAYALADLLILVALCCALFDLTSANVLIAIGAAGASLTIFCLLVERFSTGGSLMWVSQIAASVGATVAAVGYYVLDLPKFLLGCVIALTVACAIANIVLSVWTLRTFPAIWKSWQDGGDNGSA